MFKEGLHERQCPTPRYSLVLPQIGKLLGHVRKGGIVSDVPVKHVVFVHLHQVQVVFDDALGDVMSAGVNQDTTVGEPGRVHDLGAVDDVLHRLPVLHGGVHQLAERLKTPQDSPDREGDDAGSPGLVRRVDLHLVWRELKLVITYLISHIASITYSVRPCPCRDSFRIHSYCSLQFLQFPGVL